MNSELIYNNITQAVDVLRFCRICLLEVSDSASADLSSSEPFECKEILKKISLCFQINLNSEEYLPCAFCKQCVKDLNSAYSFRTKCVTIHERFKDYCANLYEKQINTVINEPNELDGGTIFDDYCSETQIRLNKETEILETEVEVNFICDLCHKILKTKESLKKHIVRMHKKRRHVGNVSGFGSARQYHCTTCAYSTPHSQTLVNHMRTHNGERPFNCDCGKSFTQASSLAAHRKIHSTTTYFTCTKCGRQFKHAFSLKTHMQVHNSGSYACHMCNKMLKSKRSLASHLDRHQNICNYKCEECWAAFVTSAELHNHKMRHIAIKNKKCHICNYATYYKKSLSDHLKSHGGIKAFKCSLCEKAFVTEGNLKRHMRVHTREKPFPCQACTQRFAHSSSLNNHMLTFHGVKFKWGDDKLKKSTSKLMKSENITS